jgi:GWxTD domain-containing protein
MTFLQACVSTPAAHALGWTLVHSLWQGALAALLLALTLRLVGPARPRYAAACLALGAMLAASTVTYALALARYQAPRSTPASRLAASPHTIALPLGPASPATAADLLPWLAPFWIAGVLAFHLRGLAGWISARRLTRRGVCAAPDPWPSHLRRLAGQLRLNRPVALLESSLARVPVVIGHLRPVILVPAGLIAGLPPGQVEAILLHELAHIRRHDYLVNLLQSFVEAFFFYHPAAWWISSSIRAEREHCCDDLVVATSGDAHLYAGALAALEQNRSAIRQAALAATGGPLARRIRRLLDLPEGPRPSAAPAFCAAVLALTAALSMAAWQAKQPVPPAAAPAPASSPYDKWLNGEVAYIISNQERAAFQSLTTNEEREHFIEQFWLRRDPTPGTVQNEFKQEHYRRIAYANAHFADSRLPGWKTDRGRIYIIYGPPDEIESHPAGGQNPPRPPFEQWRYRFIQNVGTDIIIDFEDSTLSGEYRMTQDPHASEARPPLAHLAAKVDVTDGVLRVSVPGAAAGDRVAIVGRILQSNRLKQVFQDSMPDASGVWTKALTLPPGVYRLNIVVANETARALGSQALEFEVK